MTLYTIWLSSLKDEVLVVLDSFFFLRKKKKNQGWAGKITGSAWPSPMDLEVAEMDYPQGINDENVWTFLKHFIFWRFFPFFGILEAPGSSILVENH